MTRVTIEDVGDAQSRRQARVVAWADEHAAAELGGRTVWCASGLPASRPAARELRGALEQGDERRVRARELELAAGDALRRLGERLDAMLRGAVSEASLDAADLDVYRTSVDRSEGLALSVRRDDVVVLHDPATTVLADAVRARGAHAIWRITIAPAPGRHTSDALTFVRRHASAPDAYALLSHAGRVDLIAAVIPSADAVVGTQLAIGTDRSLADVAWRSMLADVVEDDREESVGGTLRARPVVPVR